MPIWLHLLVVFVFETVISLAIWLGCLATFVAPLFALQKLIRQGSSVPWSLLLLLPASILSLWIMRRARRRIRFFRDSVPARCPVCRGLTAYARGSRPIRYECTICRAVTATGIYERGGIEEPRASP